jgi:cobalt-zinc-cadmium efflux system membrane fusion protein
MSSIFSRVHLGKKGVAVAFVAATAIAIFGARRIWAGDDKPVASSTERAKAPSDGPGAVDLTEKQVAALKIERVTQFAFTAENQTVGNIDFNQTLLVQVFTPYQGRIISADLNIGDKVEKGQVLFTIDSPDLLTAESALIAASGVRTLQTRTLNRVKALKQIGGVSQQAVDQTTSDQQTAEGAWRSARDTVRMFGKTEEEINRIVGERKADARLVVKSPISGYVTQRAAAPGLLVQPGAAPPPYVVADTSTMWMMANVIENEAPSLQVGQEVSATVGAFPDRVFSGKITVIGASVDPVTRRVPVRSEIANPDHLLRAGMFANFAIRLGAAVQSAAVPAVAIVREGDGSMTAWTTTDQRSFTRRVVRVGQRHGDLVQIIEGLRPDELIVSDGALFLSEKAALDSTH